MEIIQSLRVLSVRLLALVFFVGFIFSWLMGILGLLTEVFEGKPILGFLASTQLLISIAWIFWTFHLSRIGKIEQLYEGRVRFIFFFEVGDEVLTVITGVSFIIGFIFSVMAILS